jgi:hypothetical protein
MLKASKVLQNILRLLPVFFFVAIVSATNASAQNDADAPIPVAEITPITKTPDKTYEFTDAEPMQAIGASLDDLHGDEWGVQFMMQPTIVPNPQRVRTEEDKLKEKAKNAYRLWKAQNGVTPSVESSEEPEAVVFNPDGSIQDSWMEIMESGVIEGFDLNGPPADWGYAPEPDSPSSFAVDNPNVGVEVQVTYTNSLSPPDGGSATNGAGQTFTASNTWVEIFNASGAVLYSESPETFFSDLSPTAMVYDPRVLYDPSANRFIVVYLHGTTSNLTELYIAVSQTSNPAGSWWFYKRPANDGDANLWFDYPQVAYSDGTLTISGNMFLNGGGSSQEVKVYMMDLDAMYAGADAGTVYFDDVEIDEGVDAFSVHPCSYPFGQYGPGLYMVSRQNSNYIGYWYITANFGDGPTLNSYAVETPVTFTAATTADQAGTATNLGVPSRMMNTYVNVDGQDKIHFTYGYSDGNGDNRLLLARLNVSNENFDYETFGMENWDYATPWIMPWAANAASWDGSSLVAFSRVSSTTFPEFRCVIGHPEDGYSSGGSVGIKSGETQIQNTRWGDYIGGGWREGQSDPECWVYGQYGLGNAYGTWLAQISLNIEGCTDETACNYDPVATQNDGSCEYDSCSGCLDDEACNYNPNATIDDGSCTYPGCTNLWACNFDPNAGCNDGSCCVGSCVDLSMPYGFIDPLSGASTLMFYSLVDNATGDVVASGSNAGITIEKFCLEDGCYTLEITGWSDGQWSLDFDPVLVPLFGYDPNIDSGTGPATINFSVGEDSESSGCTDAMACNYNADAICDNGTCCYASCLTIEMTDTWGDGWNGNVWEVMASDSSIVASGTLSNGEIGIDVACLSAGCYDFSINTANGIYQYEVGWTITGTDYGNPISGGATDQTSFTIDGGGADAGCTDPDACNFSVFATCDDGSCCYENCATLYMTDEWGDGWNNNLMSVTDADGNVLTYTMDDGFQDTLIICLPNGCLDLEVGGGSFSYEVGWTIELEDFTYSGGAPFTNYLTVNVVTGCTDETACNYNPEANCPDASCAYPACMDDTACNYNECATCGDITLCIYGCQGCMYPQASNYDQTATIDDGSCEFDLLEGSSCTTDVNGDGLVTVLDILLVLGDFGMTCDPMNSGE